MEVKELQTIAFAPGVSTQFAASWSEDNKLCVITSKGIHILEITPNPTNYKYRISVRRDWLKLPDVFPTRDVGVNTSDLIWKLPQLDVYEMILNSTLAPDLVSTKPNPPSVVHVAWSPAGLLQYKRCLLAVVLNTGALLLFGPCSNKWIVVCNVSQIWHDNCKQSWDEVKPLSSASEQYDVLKKRTACLKITVAEWGQLCEDFCQLFVGHSDGQVSVWAVLPLKQVQWDKAEAQLQRVVHSGIGCLSALLWIPTTPLEMMVMGDVDGLISITSTVSSSESTAVIKKIWDDTDNIPVSRLLSLQQSDELKSKGRRIVLAVKKAFVIVFLLSHDGFKISDHAHRVGFLTISAVVPLNHNSLVLTTHTGFIGKLTIHLNEKDVFTIKSEVISSNIKMKDVACFGLASSRAQSIWALVTSTSKSYDHLVLRKPSQLTFCTLFNEIDPLDHIRNNSSTTLVGKEEYLELLRMNYVHMKTVPPLQNLQYPEKADSEAIYTVKFELWMAKMKVYLLPYSIEDEKDEQLVLTMKYVSQLEKILRTMQAVNNLRHLNHESTSRMLNCHEKLTAFLLHSWLKITFASTEDNVIPAIVTEVLSNTTILERDSVEEEKCSICQETVPMNADYDVATCVKGHKIKRCSLSMLQCCIPPYYICPSQACKAVAHKEAVSTDHVSQCIYCDSVLQMDSRVCGGRMETPRMYYVKVDTSNIRLEPGKAQNDKNSAKNKSKSEMLKTFMEQHTIIIENKDKADGSKKENVNTGSNKGSKKGKPRGAKSNTAPL